MKKNSGFVAGTLVHTNKGLVPIQEIKVGDMVLSSPEQRDRTVREYKRVVNTFKAESEEIYELIIRKTLNPDLEYVEDGILHNIYEMIYLTAGHPIYVINSLFIEEWDSQNDIDQINARSGSWQAARDLKMYDRVLVAHPQYSDSNTYEVVNIAPVQDVNRDYGFVDRSSIDNNKPFDTIVYFDQHNYKIVGGNILEGRSSLRNYFIGNYVEANFQNHSVIVKDFRENYEQICAKVGGNLEKIPTLQCSVYNFEVEDYHTYFVGEQGLWVHQ
ncbi:hypothetical protein DJ533_08815 [Acinetobacter defluvii]|uniref:Hint domain-containing protein n=1 Tax=Acinetobacter defluvii TaxID=1871111 RepID=A0A2S2FJF4_9GAMM|nr:hypothetical protein [Acinetobacter defluvii]AWL30482.1 hypothetical protein DJ533_08815 [Acinetobacter defluvii]